MSLKRTKLIHKVLTSTIFIVCSLSVYCHASDFSESLGITSNGLQLKSDSSTSFHLSPTLEISQANNLLLLNISIPQYNRLNAVGDGLQLITLSLDESSTPLQMTTVPLPYPNPFSLRNNAHIYYQLSKNANLTIHIYDSLGRRIVDSNISSGTEGGKKGINRYPINNATFNNYPLSSGVYFFIIMHEGTILGKGKLAIIP